MYQLIMLKLIGGEKWLTKKRLHLNRALLVYVSTTALLLFTRSLAFALKQSLSRVFLFLQQRFFPLKSSRLDKTNWNTLSSRLLLLTLCQPCSAHQSKVYLRTTVPRPRRLLPTTCCCRMATRLTLSLVFVCTHLHLSIKVSALQTCMIKQLLKRTK